MLDDKELEMLYASWEYFVSLVSWLVQSNILHLFQLYVNMRLRQFMLPDMFFLKLFELGK